MQPIFQAYREGQPFNQNHLRPCPMLENPEYLVKMVEKPGRNPQICSHRRKRSICAESVYPMRKTGKKQQTSCGKTARGESEKKQNRKWLKTGFLILLFGIILFRYRSYLLEGVREIKNISMKEKAGILLASTGYMLAEEREPRRSIF